MRHSTIWERPLGNLMGLSGLSEIHFDTPFFSTDEAKITDEKGRGETENVHSLKDNKNFNTTGRRNETDEEKQTEYTEFYEKQYVPKESELPILTKETAAFLSKDDHDDNDTTARTDELLDALTQRIVQDFQRFYP